MALSSLPHQPFARQGQRLAAAAARSALMAAAGTAITLACSSTRALAQALTFTNYTTTANGLGGNTVRGVYASGSSIYAATSGGLSISTNGGTSFTNTTTANGLGSNTVRGVYASGSSIYAATSGGLSISTNGGISFTNYTTDNGLGNNAVLGVYADDNYIYAGTTGGLSIAQLPSPNPVPAPLPVLGTAFALSSCRRLRRQSKRLHLASGTGHGLRA